MDLVLLTVGVLLGATCAALLVRPNRGRMHDELTAISVDVLAQTGESLAQRVAETRRARRSARLARWPGARRRSRA